MSKIAWNETVVSREEQQENKRLAVLQAGARLFNVKGYDRTSLDDIAADLNVSKRTLYYYVKNKEDILFQCNSRALGFMKVVFEDARNTDEPALDRIKVVIRGYAKLLSEDSGACLVLTRDGPLSEENRHVLRDGRRLMNAIMCDLIRTGIEEGSIAPCDPNMASAALFGAINWIPHWRKEEGAASLVDIVDQFIEILFQGLRTRPSL